MEGPPRSLRDPVEMLRRVALAGEPAEAAAAAAEAARQAVAADDAVCWLRGPGGTFEAAAGPFAEAPGGHGDLAAEVAAARAPLVLDRAGDHRRFEPHPQGRDRSGERFLGCPVTAPDGAVVAVLTATRAPGRELFGASESQVLQRLAAQVAPYLTPGEDALEALETADPADDQLFRPQAAAHHQRGDTVRADPLRLSPFWMRAAYWVLVSLAVAVALYGLLGRVDEYAVGPAVVEMAGRRDVLATASGPVASVEVERGDAVAAGQALVRLEDRRERGELAGIERELRLQLVGRLRDPSDEAARQALISLRAQRELAAARLAERTLRAPEAGTVADLWTREGQFLEAGQAVLSLAAADAAPTLLVLVPGHYRPLLAPGLPLRFEIAGYRSATQRLEVGAVGDEVVGPAEARRYLGPGGDAVPVDGAVVLVAAPMPSATFEAGGETHRFHHRMMGTAEIRVRSERIVFAVAPALKQVFVDGGA